VAEAAAKTQGMPECRLARSISANYVNRAMRSASLFKGHPLKEDGIKDSWNALQE